MALEWGPVGYGYEVTDMSPQRPGTIAALGTGWHVTVWPSAKSRPDWAAMLQALGTAFQRGAVVEMHGE